MRIASPAKLAAIIDKNLAWRKKELTQFKFLADSALPQDAKVLRRSGIAMMYAHWEGFIKEVSVVYLRHLATEEVEVAKLKSCFIAVVLHADIYSAGRAKKKSLHAGLVDLLRSVDAPPPKLRRIPFQRVITTRSNLKGAVLREIVATLGIDYSPFELKEQPVINRLVKFRNLIAHGGGIPIPQLDYDILHAETIALMDVYKDLIQDAAYNDRHFR